MKKYNEYDIEQELMEAFTLEQTDAEIGMPDIEEELRRAHSLAESRSKPWKQIVSIAACVIVMLGIGLAGYQNMATDKDLCVAYVGGNRITDEAKVMQMMSEDISHMNGGNEIIEEQLSTIFNE